MTLSGQVLVGSRRITTDETFHAVNPATRETLQPPFSAAGTTEVDAACTLAWEAFAGYRFLDSERRAGFLEAIADQIMALGDALPERAQAETGLPIARLNGERARTVAQLRLFADELRKGYWRGLRVDPALPERTPLPRPDLRQYRVPLGPVAVFGASNFPLAFSVAGGDTAAALAAGCPVIVKGHPAHPGTGELVAQAVIAAVTACGLPEGTFSLLNSPANEVGAALVSHPHIKAVAFTGSRAGGLALTQIASQRPEPIPVYAEMSSVNPVVLLPAALAARADSLAKDYVASMTLGAGQFCTNPGLILALAGPDLDRFMQAAGEALKQAAPAVMLTAGIRGAFERGVDRLRHDGKVTMLARGRDSSPACASAALFAVAARDLIEHPDLAEEVFGASSIVVRCTDESELLQLLGQLEGQLTVTLQLDRDDSALAARLLPVLELKAGRLIANGWPTGVEVAHAMVHGGPFPATSDGRSTSVGTLAIERFLRPLCYQGFPDALLPAVLRDAALQSQPHRLDGLLQTGTMRRPE